MNKDKSGGGGGGGGGGKRMSVGIFLIQNLEWRFSR